MISSSYDYKNNEFSFGISQKSYPEIIFNSTIDELNNIDRNAAAQCTEYLYKIIFEALGNDFDNLQYSINIYEDFESPGILERDPKTHLSQNRFVVDLSQDSPVIDPLQVDTIFADMTLRISEHLDTAIGGLKLRAGVWDGKNYFHTEIDLR